MLFVLFELKRGWRQIQMGMLNYPFLAQIISVCASYGFLFGTLLLLRWNQSRLFMVSSVWCIWGGVHPNCQWIPSAVKKKHKKQKQKKHHKSRQTEIFLLITLHREEALQLWLSAGLAWAWLSFPWWHRLPLSLLTQLETDCPEATKALNLHMKT